MSYGLFCVDVPFRVYLDYHVVSNFHRPEINTYRSYLHDEPYRSELLEIIQEALRSYHNVHTIADFDMLDIIITGDAAGSSDEDSVIIATKKPLKDTFGCEGFYLLYGKIKRGDE